MKITITDAKCGLEKGRTYDLCEMSARTLIQKGQALAVREPAAADEAAKKGNGYKKGK
jgi:hypothetical protein